MLETFQQLENSTGDSTNNVVKIISIGSRVRAFRRDRFPADYGATIIGTQKGAKRQQ